METSGQDDNTGIKMKTAGSYVKSEQFVSEPIQPVRGSLDTSGMTCGEPGFPMKFKWRNKEYSVDEIVAKWKGTSQCRNGSDEQYVRKHWFRIRTTERSEMKIYFERQPRSKSQSKTRWWLYSVLPREESSV